MSVVYSSFGGGQQASAVIQPPSQQPAPSQAQQRGAITAADLASVLRYVGCYLHCYTLTIPVSADGEPTALLSCSGPELSSGTVQTCNTGSENVQQSKLSQAHSNLSGHVVCHFAVHMSTICNAPMQLRHLAWSGASNTIRCLSCATLAAPTSCSAMDVSAYDIYTDADRTKRHWGA